MNTLEMEMSDILADLKENHNVVSVKAEFEAEGAALADAVRLKEIADKSGLNFAIKIGGCEAVRDLYDAKFLCANEIIAPMIETPYALKKYVNAINRVFPPKKKSGIKFYINIETVTGYNNLQDIISANEFSEISGIVLGRDDMSASMDFADRTADSELMLCIACQISEKMKLLNKEFTVGGNMCPESLLFLSKIPYVTRYETRKVIFKSCEEPDYTKAEGILKALDFEIKWIQNKRDNYGVRLEEDEERLRILKSRIMSTEKTEL